MLISCKKDEGSPLAYNTSGGWISITPLLVAIALCSGLLAYTTLVAPPSDFQHAVVKITEGMSVQAATEELAREGVVQSPSVLQGVVQVLGDRNLIAGDYVFNQPETVFAVGERITSGSYGQEILQITIPEGFSNQDIANRLDENLGDSFSQLEFLEHARAYEGYLFPDTYTLFPTDSATEVITIMQDNFHTKIAPLRDEMADSGQTLEEVIIMASLLEGEAATLEDRQKIADILWDRIENGMPLQVDVVFEYILGKNTYELTTEDLQVDSPYNTYLYPGLPPGPISNPGLVSIHAAITPIDTNYVYYLSDRDGEVYYSEVLEEHNRKKALYINNEDVEAE